MIPWDTFKTPQDAYEWTQRNFDTFLGVSSKWLGPKDGYNSFFASFWVFDIVTLPVIR